MKKIGRYSVKYIKMKNRKGYAAICNDCLTEGLTKAAAYSRMVKAIARIEKKKKKK